MSTKTNFLLLAILLVLPCLVLAQLPEGKLILMDTATGASCLDGSPTGYYYKPGAGADKNKFLIYFMGGSSCVGMTSWGLIYDCISRSSTPLGSSKDWAKTLPNIPNSGILDQDNADNKFKNWSLFFIQYCDGAFHQGLNNNPSYLMSWFVKRIYMRGDTNTKVMFKSMIDDFGMKDADDVVLSGISAGAMAAMYWADYLGSQLDLTKTNYISAPDSGYTYDMKHITMGFHAANMLASILYPVSNYEKPFPNADCVAAHKDTPYTCIFGDHLHKYIKSDMFLIQSQYDTIWMGAGLGMNCFEWTEYTLKKCNAEEMKDIQLYNDNVKISIDGYRNNTSARRGGWVPACPGHVFTLFKPFYSPLFEIPENSGLNHTLQETLLRFVQGSNIETMLVDDVKYPDNRNCAYYNETFSIVLTMPVQEMMAQDPFYGK